jgi:hypothetical protein
LEVLAEAGVITLLSENLGFQFPQLSILSITKDLYLSFKFISNALPTFQKDKNSNTVINYVIDFRYRFYLYHFLFALKI